MSTNSCQSCKQILDIDESIKQMADQHCKQTVEMIFKSKQTADKNKTNSWLNVNKHLK